MVEVKGQELAAIEGGSLLGCLVGGALGVWGLLAGPGVAVVTVAAGCYIGSHIV